MKKDRTKKTALLFSCLMLSMTGCHSTTPAPTTTPTAVLTTAPTAVLTSAPTAVLTTAPTAVLNTAPTAVLTSAPTAVPTTAPTAMLTTAPTATPAPAEDAANHLEIMAIEISDAHTILVTLNDTLTTINPDDLSFTYDQVDWSTYKKSSGNLTITKSVSSTNAEGKTVLAYTVAETLRKTSIVIEKKASNFSDLTAAVTLADNYVSWQMENGGWDKGIDGKTTWDGKTKKNKGSGWTGKNGELIGTIDNDATYTQLRHIAAVYREVPEEKYKESVQKAFDFLFHLQYDSGGFAQVYPRRGNYSDMVTFNDNAMINVLFTLEDALYSRYPFDSDILPEEYKAKLQDSIDRAIDFILKAQITSQGKLTAWCAQHDPVTYQPVAARAYELPSISGSESVPVIQFLMNQEQTPEIQTAVEAAIQWLKASEQKDTEYVRKASDGVYFKTTAGQRTWYRFYEIDTNLPIFCDRDGIKKHDILEIGEERRHGYAWAGSWGKKLLDAYDKYGDTTGTITATVTGTSSSNAEGKTLEHGTAFTVGTPPHYTP